MTMATPTATWAKEAEDTSFEEPAADILSSSFSSPGSMEQPHLCYLDLEYPERTRDFNPVVVDGMERNLWRRKAVHIRKTIVACDREMWTATVPALGQFGTELDNKCMLVKGPSRDFFQRQVDIYHGKEFKCTPTKKSHEDLESSIMNSTGREWTYYLLVFPEEIANTLFVPSGSDNVPTKEQIINLKKDNPLNVFSKDIVCISVYWEMAFTCGGVPVSSSTDSKKPSNKLFD
jgi:hypothetical protein